MGIKVKVRVAKRKDRQEIKDINEKCLPVGYELEEWEKMISAHNSHVMVTGGKVIGYVVSDVRPENTAVVISFALLPEYRGKGYGKQLLMENINHFRDKKTTSLSLRAMTTNTIALKLYESVGFKKIKLLEKYYDGKYDGWLMQLDY